jgi:formate hydrogenlyase transcriptional activator
MEKRTGLTLGSCCVVPLISHERKLGVLGVASAAENAFSEDDEELMVEIGTQIAIAVENMLNFEQLKIAQEQVARGRDRLELLLKVNNALVSHLDLHDLMGAVWAILHDVIHHDFAALALYNASADQMRVYAPDHRYSGKRVVVEDLIFPLKGSVAEGAVRTGRTVYAPKLDTATFDSAIVRRFKAFYRSRFQVDVQRASHDAQSPARSGNRCQQPRSRVHRE